MASTNERIRITAIENPTTLFSGSYGVNKSCGTQYKSYQGFDKRKSCNTCYASAELIAPGIQYNNCEQ
jgi:hypothetical protein